MSETTTSKGRFPIPTPTSTAESREGMVGYISLVLLGGSTNAFEGQFPYPPFGVSGTVDTETATGPIPACTVRLRDWVPDQGEFWSTAGQNFDAVITKDGWMWVKWQLGGLGGGEVEVEGDAKDQVWNGEEVWFSGKWPGMQAVEWE